MGVSDIGDWPKEPPAGHGAIVAEALGTGGWFVEPPADFQGVVVNVEQLRDLLANLRPDTRVLGDRSGSKRFVNVAATVTDDGEPVIVVRLAGGHADG